VADHEQRDQFSFGADWSADSGSVATRRIEIATPRLRWLVLAATAGLVGLGLAALLGQLILPAIAGWLLSGPVAIGLLAVHLHSESQRRAMPASLDYAWLRPGYVAVLVLALVAVVVSALRIALWAGRL
jgi:hypothetical protein